MKCSILWRNGHLPGLAAVEDNPDVVAEQEGKNWRRNCHEYGRVVSVPPGS